MEQPQNIEELDNNIESREREKSESPGMVRKILFVLSPKHGWGVSTLYNKKDNIFWFILPILMLLAGIALGVYLLFLR